MIGAHPDDADQLAGGTAIKFVKLGHRVMFVSLTNGDAGHYSSGGGVLAKLRRSEAEEAGKRFGVVYKVLDNHDGELVPELNIRFEVIRLIREWNADIVIGPRPNDYHPDHRNTAIIVQDAAYMVRVPNIASDVQHLNCNPVFLYMEDDFNKPYPFEPDIAIDISEEYEQKIFGMAAHESQYFQWLPWLSGSLNDVPKNEEERVTWLAELFNKPISPSVKKSLIKWYGKGKADSIKHAEAFEICEYGYTPDSIQIRQLFPMLE